MSGLKKIKFKTIFSDLCMGRITYREGSVASGRVSLLRRVILKIFFEKAYDHVDWGFVDEVLPKKGYKNRWRNWIWGCLVSVNIWVLVNANPSAKFGASRGLRQVDPLSPFFSYL